ncbi:hypothetical protein EAH89_09760 [Roseomonas nepalensis]|uniref:GAF domain-containing protein n=1 Tax=Muricoccus nepalensis TaxID=1854500 RepID=A0A502G766_9PROT|nr:hypothetical protein [Roseomonas nepalensis]TPG57709.1 hypothetical protein EAH89_09760 [Roseomonas nepalensis]
MPRRSARLGERAPRRILGIRVTAILETLAFLGGALILAALLPAEDRFLGIKPHPFWIIVLLVATQYGTGAALFAAAAATAALLVGNMPEQELNEDLYAWLLRVTMLPIQWLVVGLVLGQVRDSHRLERDGLREELSTAREQAQAITKAYERLLRIKDDLEVRVAGQLDTLRSTYDAFRSIDGKHTADILVGVATLVRAVIRPDQFSLFSVNGTGLEVVATEGWTVEEGRATRFDPSSPLFESVVVRREILCLANPDHEALLGGEGVLAGPIVSQDEGAVVGMLKIEGIAFTELHPSAIGNFRVVCDRIGVALDHARRLERLRVPPSEPRPADAPVALQRESVAEMG